jgi:hypothetical protein
VIQHWILGFLEHGTERLENRDATLLGPIERRLPLAVACVPYQRRMKKAIKRARPYCDSEIPSPATPHPTGKIGYLSALRIPIHVGEDKKKFVGSQMGRRPRVIGPRVVGVAWAYSTKGATTLIRAFSV